MSETAPANATVFVVDDDEPVREAIAFLLETVDLNCETFADARAFLDHYDTGRRGCLVLDIRMPGMSGLELQAYLAEHGVTIPIIFITGHGDIPMAVEAMRRGAIDFIRKPFRDEDLIERIHEALALEQNQRETEAEWSELAGRAAALTPRESEVFARVAEGQANKVVAIELGISERTVEIHRSQVMQKMRARNLAQLVRMKIALEQGEASC